MGKEAIFLFKLKNHKRIVISILVIIFLLSVLYISGFIKKPCFSESCFENALQKCSQVNYVANKNNNIYLYSTYLSFGNECKIKVSLEKVAPGSDQDIKALEKKSMICKLPKKLLKQNPLEKINNVLCYCHGDLKEGLLELILKKMYSLIVGNINEVLENVGNLGSK